MKLERWGIEMTLPDLLKAVSLPRGRKEQPKPGVAFAYFKEYLEAFIHDERYEEAAQMNEKSQEFKRSLA